MSTSGLQLVPDQQFTIGPLVVGSWVAHIPEYQEDNRLIRPRARYVGPEDRAFVRIDER